MAHRGFGRDVDTGVHTVEGNLAGGRAARLTKKREKEQQEFEKLKSKIKEDATKASQGIDSKFSHAAGDYLEGSFKAKTYGLVSAEDFRRAREEVEQGLKKQVEQKAEAEQKALEDSESTMRQKAERRKKKRKRQQVKLSFGDEEEIASVAIQEPQSTDPNVQEEKAPVVVSGSLKNPNVDTSFLPDRAREAALAAERDRLQQEWLEDQERIKQETLEITYSYWDGSGHRRVIQVPKGITIGRFVEQVKVQRSSEFSELKSRSADDLLYVKEDLIIPHHISFYELIVTKARGKSGPLFHFDVHEDVRLEHDIRVEKDDAHPGKVVERHWFETNKHIFPASRWEIYDPALQRAGPYTIHGGEVQAKGKKQKRN